MAVGIIVAFRSAKAVGERNFRGAKGDKLCVRCRRHIRWAMMSKAVVRRLSPGWVAELGLILGWWRRGREPHPSLNPLAIW